MNFVVYLIPLLLAVSIPVALAQVETTGENYDLIENFQTGEATWTSHPERIMIGDDWKNYHLSQSDDKIIFNSNSVGTLIYDVPSCSYSVYNIGYEGETIFSSVSWIPRIANGDADNWQTLTVLDNQSCEINITESENGIHILSTKKIIEDVVMPKKIDGVWIEQPAMFNNGTSNVMPNQVILRMVQDLNVDIYQGIKETVSISNTNPAYGDDYKFGLIQTLNLEKDTITINGDEVNISSVSGMQFDRDWVIENEAYILEIADGINYDIDEGINQLNSITILDENGTNKIALDYSYASDVTLLFNSFTVDPNITIGGVITGSNIDFNLASLSALNLIQSGSYAGTALTSSELTTIQNSLNAGSNTYQTALQQGLGIIYTNDYDPSTGVFTDTYNNAGTTPDSPYTAGGPAPAFAFKILSGHPAHNVPIDKVYLNFWSDEGNGSGSGVTGTANVYFHGSNFDTSRPTTVTASNTNSAKNCTSYSSGCDIPNGGVGTYNNGGQLAQYDPATIEYSFSPPIYFLDSGTTSGDRTHIVVEAQSITSYYMPTGWQALRMSLDDDLYNGNEIYGYCGTHWYAGASLGYFDTGPYGSCRNMLPDNGNGTYGSVGSAKNPRITFEGQVTHTNLELTYNIMAVPNAPTNLQGVIGSGGSIDLSWSASTDLGGGSLLGFNLERSTDGGSSWTTLVANTGNSDLTHNDSFSLSSGQSYTYQVASINLAGSGAFSSTTTQISGTGPNAPTGVQVSITDANVNPLDIFVQYSSPTDVGTGTLTGFEIYRDNVLIDTLGLVNSYVDYSVSIGSHSYFVKAISTHGTSVASNTDNITTPNVPSTITDLSGAVISDTQINLSWSASSDGGSNLEFYKIFKDGVQVDTTTNITYALTGLSSNTAYTITVYANNSVGDSLVSNAITKTTYQSVSGSITITKTTVGATSKLEFTPSVTGTPSPNFSTFTLKEGVTVLASGISTPYYLSHNDGNSHTYTISSYDGTHWSTPTISGAVTETSTYNPNWNNDISYNYTRANGVMDLIVNRDSQTLWDASCNYKTTAEVMSDGAGITSNSTGVWNISESQAVADIATVYVSCTDGEDTLFSFTSFGPNRLGGGIAQLNDTFEGMIGTPVALIFVLLVAGLFTGRSAPTGILLVLALVGVLGFVGMLVIEEAIWGFLLLAGVLGIFLGKRFL